MVLDPRKQKGDFLNPEQILKSLGVEGNMKFADFGCGAGFFTIPAARMVGEHGQIYAVDVLKSELADVASKAKIEGLLNLKTVWADLEIPRSTKLKDNSIDMVFLAHVFYQSKKPEAVLAEAKRVVKSSGRIVVLEWEKVDTPFGPPLDERVSKDEMKEMIQQAGLEIESEFTAGSYHYGLVLRKTDDSAPSASDTEVQYD